MIKNSEYFPDMSKQEIFDKIFYYFVDWVNFDRKVLAFLVSQCMLETGWCQSEVFHQNNNLFGMRHPKVRVNLSLGKINGHASYVFLSDSFLDYLLWMQYNGFTMADLNNIDLFTCKLRKSNFNPSDKYVDTVLKIYKTYYHE